MIKTVALLLALLTNGCFLDSLVGTSGDDQETIVYRQPEPNPPVIVKGE